MNINETPTRAPGRLPLAARRARALRTSGHGSGPTTEEGEAHRAAPFAVLGEAVASLYVAVARRVLLGIEAIEDRRAEARPAVLRDPVAPPSRSDG